MLLAALLLASCHVARQPDARQPELVRLDMLVGHWESSHETRVEGSEEVTYVTSTVHARWELDGNFVVARATYRIGGIGGDETRVKTLFTWDDQAGVYRTWAFDTHGNASTGTMRFDAATRTWHMKQESRNRVTDARGKGHGTMHYEDDDHKTFTWSQQAAGGSKYTARGRSRRVAR